MITYVHVKVNKYVIIYTMWEDFIKGEWKYAIRNKKYP